MQIKLINKFNQEVIQTFPRVDLEKAYKLAQVLENNGMEVIVQVPTIMEDLEENFALNEVETENFRESIERELIDHDGRDCC